MIQHYSEQGSGAEAHRRSPSKRLARGLFLVASLCLIGACAANSPAEKVSRTKAQNAGRSVPELIAAISPSMMRVIILFREEGRIVPVVNGSAFVVGPNGLVATAAHVIDGFSTESLLIVPSDVRDVVARDAGVSIVAIDREHDLALLRAEAATSRTALEIAPATDVAVGEDALLLGFPLGDPVLTVSRAMIAAKILRPLANSPPATRLIKLDASVNTGNSGGPVIRISTGKVIGIASLKEGSLQNRLQRLAGEKQASDTDGKVNDPVELIRAIVADMEKHLQLGLGYAVAIEHLQDLLDTAGEKSE